MSIECPTDKNSIVFENVSFQYTKEPIVTDVSFVLPRGDFAAIVGPNGAGKSTLLKLLLGVLEPQKGCITVFGHSVDKAKVHMDIGYVPQKIVSSEINIPATVEEVVESGQVYFHELFSKRPKRDKHLVKEALKQVGLLELRRRQIRDLSGGERQRLFIARALAREPKILILDEPTVGVDIVAKEKFFALLQRLNGEGLTIVIVSHDVDIMAEKTKHILGLNRKLVCDISAEAFDPHQYLHDLYGEEYVHQKTFLH